MKPGKDMYQLCREIFGTDDEAELRKIAKKAGLYDDIHQKEHSVNLRGAGRKSRFTETEIAEMTLLYREGVTMEQIAKKYETSRQTISKYLTPERRRYTNRYITMRMNYMHREKLCTVIDVNFKERKIYIINKTDNILHRAFGVVTEPTWEDFEYFLEERCFPRSRAHCKDILRDLGLDCYDPLQIIEKTQGRMAEDHQWIEIEYREQWMKEAQKIRGVNQLERNIT